MSGLLAARAHAADRQVSAAGESLKLLRRLRLLVPVGVLVAAAAVGVVTSSVHVVLSPAWWAVFAGGLPAAAWWILEAACRSQHRAVLRADAIREAAWMAAARRKAHLTVVDG